MTQFFNNRTLIAPQVEVAVDDSGLQPTSPDQNQVAVGILGYSTKGTPKVPLRFVSADQAIATLGQGSLLDGILRCLAPSTRDLGATVVYGIRVNEATQSALNLLDAASATAIALTSVDYGVFTRGLSVKVEAATGGANIPSNAVKVTTTDGSIPASQDNLGYNVLKVSYNTTGGIVQVKPWTGTIGTGYTAGTVATIPVSSGGAGYSSPPTVVISAPDVSGGTQAVATAVVTSNVVTSVTIGTPGSGYTQAPEVSLTGGGFSTEAVLGTPTITGPHTSLVVATAETGMTVKQIVPGQRLLLHGGGTANHDYTVTVVTSDGAGNLTVSPGDAFIRTTSTTVVATGASLLLKGGSGADTGGFPLGNYATLAALAAAADALSANWQVQTPVSFNQAPNAVTSIGRASSPTILDVGVAPVSLTSNPGFTNQALFGTLTGVAQAVTDWLSGTGQPYFSATRNMVTGTVPVTTAPVFAAGGDDDGSGGSLLLGESNLDIVNQDWSDALVALQTVDTPLFVLMTGNASLHSLGDAHASYMSSTGKLERVQIAGGFVAESTQDAIDRAVALDSFRTALVYPGVQDFDLSGNLQTLAPYYAAATVAGVASGVGEATALTNETVRLQGLEKRTIANGGPFVQADYDALLLNGVMPIQFKPKKGYTIVQSLTTWQEDPRYDKRELSVRRTVDRISRSVRDVQDQLIGHTIGPALINDAVALVDAVLESYAEINFIVGDEDHPPYQAIQAQVQPGRADTLLVSYEASPGIPANYILTTMHLTTFVGSSQSAV